MTRLLPLLFALVLVGCSDDPGSGPVQGDAGADVGDNADTTGDAQPDTDPADTGDADVPAPEDGGDSGDDADTADADARDAGDAEDAMDTGDATDTGDTTDSGDATDADDAGDAGDADVGEPATPEVVWSERRGLSVAGKRALVLLDSQDRPVVIAPRGGVTVVAYTADGAERWSLSLTATPINDAAAVIGPDDVVYVFFDFRSLTIDRQRIDAAGGSDLALLAISGDGALLWHEIWTTEESERAVGLGVDAQGGLYLAGAGDNGTLEIGGARISGWPSRFVGFWDPAHFVVALDSERQQRWTKVFGLLDVQFTALTTAPDGTTYLGVNLRTDIDFGSGPTGTPDDGTDLGFAAFDAQGTNLWTTRLAEPGGGQVLSVGVDADGRLLATAALLGNRITSSNVPSISNRAGGTILAFDHEGVERFRDTWPVGSLWVASRNDGGPLLSGHILFDPVDFGGGPLQTAGEHDAVLVGLDDDGGHLWSLSVGTRNREVFTGGAGSASGRWAVGVGVATGGQAPDYGAGPTEALSDFDALIIGVRAP